MTSSAAVVPALPHHLSSLAAVERAAATLFPDDLIPPAARAMVVPADVLSDACADGRLWVALAGASEPVGFALAEIAGGAAFLAEVDVHPDHQRRGLGRALVRAVIAWAAARGLRRVRLTTFASVPWNAPFYERLGFRRLDPDALDDDLTARLCAEAADGLRDRVAMELDLLEDPV